MWDLEKLEQIVRAEAASVGDQKILSLSSSEIREFLRQYLSDHIRHQNQ